MRIFFNSETRKLSVISEIFALFTNFKNPIQTIKSEKTYINVDRFSFHMRIYFINLERKEGSEKKKHRYEREALIGQILLPQVTF